MASALNVEIEENISVKLKQIIIDWSKTPISLEKELQKITADSHESKRFVDKLFQIWLKNKDEVWILIHILKYKVSRITILVNECIFIIIEHSIL